MKIEALTRAGFAPFGEVIEFGDVKHFPINQGFAERFNDQAHVDVSAEGGSVNISLLIANPRPKPIAIKLVERHPLGSQIFYPLQDRPWLVVACEDPKDRTSFRCFRATGQQGINYKRNAWHHPLLVLEAESRFMIVDRKGPGVNLEEVSIDEFRLDLP
jgi:ureidoglycolate lyase